MTVATYTLTADLEVSTQTQDGPVVLTYKAGNVSPASGLEEQIFGDLERAGVVAIAAPKTKTPKAPAEETE